jgi:hypothetical protein
MLAKTGMVFLIISVFGSIVMHFVTVWLVYNLSGLLYGFIAFCTPILSAFYVGAVFLGETGKLLTTYNIVWMVLWVLYKMGREILAFEKRVI